MQTYYVEPTTSAIPIVILTENDLTAWFAEQTTFVKTWVQSNGFTAKSNTILLIPKKEGGIAQVVVGVKDREDFWSYADLASRLPEGIYTFKSEMSEQTLQLATMAWGLQTYRFDRYKKNENKYAQLSIPSSLNLSFVTHMVEAVSLVRDLINTPTEDMGPEQLADAAKTLSKQHSAHFTEIVGDKLLKENYFAIHAVGRASTREPRLIDVTWGNAKHPKIVLVGKGVCFDSGGLDIKSATGMRLMKKDMGGAAHVLGLAHLIMAMKLPIHLRVLISAVENVISGNAYRPGDVVGSKKGLTIEIGNTDAEGRVVLADALHTASQKNPELIIDFATLTGAARIATGAELPAMFCNHDEIADELLQCAKEQRDPMWRMPLYQPYRKFLDSSIANICNESSSSYGGAITAALFLQEFIGDNIPWVHFDLMAWNLSSKPGRPEGGEAMALRAVYAYLVKRFLK